MTSLFFCQSLFAQGNPGGTPGGAPAQNQAPAFNSQQGANTPPANPPSDAQMPSQNSMPQQMPQYPPSSGGGGSPTTNLGQPYMPQPPPPNSQNPPLPVTNLSFDSPEEKPKSTGLKTRDPFKMPEYLLIKIRQKMAAPKPQNVIDETVEPIRRWPLASYVLVGIMWDVNHPKAMFQDKANNIHMLRVNDFIGSNKGIVTRIESGSVTVIEGKIPQVIRLKK